MAAEERVGQQVREYLHRALCRLYDLAAREVDGRPLPRSGEQRERPDSRLWRYVHTQIARQMERDRRAGVSTAPDRYATFHWQTFRQLRADITLNRPITEDRQRVVEALARLGEPDHVLPSGLRRGLEQAAGRLWLFAARRAGDGGSGHRKLVDEISERARQDMLLLDQGSAGAPPVSLRDVYVRRGTEERLARVLQQQVLAGSPGQPVQVVLGEAGTGKSSLLWYLAELLEGRRAAAPLQETRTDAPSDEIRAGAAFRPVLLRAEQLLAPGEGEQLLESFELSLKPGWVALLDTADLLLHARDGRGMLRRAVAVCQERGVPLVLTCRTRDSAALHDVLEATPSDVVFHVGDFQGGEELEGALSTYCLHYLPASSPAARAEAVAALLEAAVRGLPVREVVARPLTLRMLFEVYAPQSPTAEIDAAGLYERYWERRVREDARHGSAGHAAAQSPDLSWPAQSLARLMLHDGTVALPVADAAGRMPGANPEAGDGDPLEQLAQLDRRSVVAGTSGRRSSVHFFHQTLFEYAAGRCLVRLAAEKKQSYYRALGRHLAQNPDDYLRAVVAEQALVQGMRAKGRVKDDAAELLSELLGSEDVDLQVIAVRACALLPDDLYGDIREVFHRYLRETASPAMVREVLALLPTREHTDPVRVAEDLGVVLKHSSRMQSRVLDLLCRFGRLDGRTADAVWTLLRELCAAPARCLRRAPDPEDAAPTGCGGEDCLWSWLVNLNSNSAGSHGNQAVRLIDALADHRSEWTAERMRELLALAERHRSRPQALQCVAVIHRRAGDPEWDALFPVAARIAQRLGTDKALAAEGGDEQEGSGGGAWGARTPGEEWRQAQAALDAYWFAAALSTPDRSLGSLGSLESLRSLRSLEDVIRALAAEGKNPFDVPKARLRAVLGQVGTRLREATEGVPELLEETVALCRGRDTVDQVAAFLLPPLLREPAGDPGTRAAAAWCADRLDVFDPRANRGRRSGSPALRFAVNGLGKLPPARLADIVRWPSEGGRWGDNRIDDTFLALDGATKLLVPLAASGHTRALTALERWRTLEGLRHDQLAQGRNAWPEFRGGKPYHGSKFRDTMSGVIQAALTDHAAQAHRLLLEALRRRVPTADVPWLAALAKSTVEQPGPAAAPARALFDRFGPELAEWCAGLWDVGPCPDTDAKLAALRLWGDVVRMGAADRPSLTAQARLVAKVRNRQWPTACHVLRHWNGHDVSSVAAVSGEPGWEELDAALAFAVVPDASTGEVALLRSFLRCRFAPLATREAVAAAVDTVAGQVRLSCDTAAIHDSGAGFLAERLCAIDPGQAVGVAIEVARRTAGSGLTDPHHVTRLGWKWQKPLTRMASTADREDWLRLIGGLADGPQALLQKALDTAAARRREEDVRADAARELAASPYRDAAMAGLRDAAVRHRRTPLEERLWPAVLQPAGA
ncbi:ATP-binding protein [Streptomyces sp. NBC_00091]|uniref:ATP-binding protein n=1 Tax=Streptomyces sp. NBC_00091 TaxID=2975648 RepID=UPI0022512E8B|nr:ATP-binding protein [Streptomyces sp. NBC_00091]MCX5380407.1 ATP-binding protein [Streptomyces sp. NBC_00091]